jgi:hypothetical protein
MARRLDYEKESKRKLVSTRGGEPIDYSDRTLPPSGYPRLGDDFSVERRQPAIVTPKPVMVQETLEEAAKAAIRAYREKMNAKRQLRAKRAAADAKRAAAKKAASENRKIAALAKRRKKKHPVGPTDPQTLSKAAKPAAVRKPTTTVKPTTVVQSTPGGKCRTVQVEFKTAPKTRTGRPKP